MAANLSDDARNKKSLTKAFASGSLLSTVCDSVKSLRKFRKVSRIELKQCSKFPLLLTPVVMAVARPLSLMISLATF